MHDNTYMEDKKYGDEFKAIVLDILNHPQFEIQKTMVHHGGMLYRHSLAVAYNSYCIARKLGLDAESVARGALLHDFFFDNWRESDTSSRKGIDRIREMHGFSHPKKALKNAQTCFTLNDKEADMIVKHMFPLTPALPKYRESWIVSLVDKGIAIKEMVQAYTPFLRRRLAMS